MLDLKDIWPESTWLPTNSWRRHDPSNKTSVCDKKGTLPGGINTATQTFRLSSKDQTWTWAQKYQDEGERLRPIYSLWFARNHHSHHLMICTCAVKPFRRLCVGSWVYSFSCVGCDVRRRLEGSAEHPWKTWLGSVGLCVTVEGSSDESNFRPQSE